MPVYFKNTSHDIIFGESPIEKMGGNKITFSMYGDEIPVIETITPFIQTGDITKDNILSFDCSYNKDSFNYTYNIEKFPEVWQKGASINNEGASYIQFESTSYSKTDYEARAWTNVGSFEIIFAKPMFFKKLRFTYQGMKENTGCTTRLYNGDEIMFSDRFLEYKYASWAYEGDEGYGTGQIIIDSDPDEYKVFQNKRTIEYSPNVISNRLEFIGHGFKYLYSNFRIYAINIEADLQN